MYRAAFSPALLLGAALLAAGCGSGVNLPEDEGTPSTVAAALVGPPSSTTPTEIALLTQKGMVKVGDTVEHAFRLMPAPQGGYEFRELPPKFQAPYGARGWEAGREGFGVITHHDLVVAAMYQLDRADEPTLEETTQAYQGLLGEPSHRLGGGNVRYWFWGRGTQSLMICALRKARGLHITIAMGDNVVLEGLGISPKEAAREKARTEETLASPGSPATPPGSTNG